MRRSLPLLLVSCTVATAPQEDPGLAQMVPCVASLPGSPSGTADQPTAGCSANPEVPSKLRSLTPIQGGQFQGPHIPPLRTSRDGRVALNNKGVPGGAGFYLFAPEKVQQDFVDSTPGAHVLADTDPLVVDRDELSPPGGFAHATLCDAGRGWGDASAPNPYACPDGSGEDCYDLFTIAAQTGNTSQGTIRMVSRRVTIRVRDPKTPDAMLVPDFEWQEGYVQGPEMVANTMFEPMVTDDGHLLAGRIGTNGMVWTPPAGVDPALSLYTDAQRIDLAYAVHPPGGGHAPCDVTGWSDMRPPSFAPHDPWMFEAGEPRYGIAVYPFRSADGELIQPGRYFHSSYPWLDREGRNLFYSTVNATLYVNDSDDGVVTTRFPAACPPDHPAYDPADPFGPCPHPDGSNLSLFDETSITRGATILGLWSHGKQVLLDDPVLNNIDFGMRLNDDMHREISLYGDSPTRPAPLVRVGVGRDNSAQNDFPPGATLNLNFLESTEHLFHTNPALVPVMARDVVWILNSGRGSAEVSFDDLMHPDAMVVSDMVPLVDAEGVLYDGFDARDSLDEAENNRGPGWSASEPVRVQNGASTLPHRWVIPPYGAVHGLARVENVSMGGIQGKGLWLQTDAGITYDIPNQPQPTSAKSWFTGVFVDPRTGSSADPHTGLTLVERQLLGFPDGSSLQLVAADQLAYVSAAGITLHSVTLHPDDALFDESWTHIGLVTKRDGQEIDLYVDGYLQDRWLTVDPIFRITPGTLTVGAPLDGSVDGVRGWYDEVRVFAEEPHRELICNLAHGTLAEVDPGLDTPWRTIAQRRAPWIHQELDGHLAARGNPTSPLHACVTDHGSDRKPDPRSMPLGTTPIREAYIHPEGLLEYGQPRPDTTGNPHCLSCHVDEPGRPASLTTAALSAAPIPVEHDPRRQPIQPPARLYGHIPADFASPGRPARPVVAPSYGCQTDALLLGPLPDLCWCEGASADLDNDGLDDCIDPCPDSPLGDVEPNGICEGEDLCIGDDSTGDTDGDSVCDSHDRCAGDDLVDTDSDGIPDDCDACPLDAGDDLDGDGICLSDDQCRGFDDAAGCDDLRLSWHASYDDGDNTWEGGDVSWTMRGALFQPVGSAHGGITHAFTFDGVDSAVSSATWSTLLPTSGSATFETWFRVDDPASIGRELIWETGGAGSGISFVLNGTQVESWLTSTPPVTATLTPEMLGDFIHLAVVTDRDADTLTLYLNGVMQSSVPASHNSWTGGNSAAIATGSDDSIGGNDGDELDDLVPFRGDLAIIDVHTAALPAAAIETRYDGIHCGLDDPDGDGLFGACDPCPLDVGSGDADGDGVCDADDLCDGDDAADADLDGVPDACDLCPLDLLDDSDGDGVCDGDDRCPTGDDALDDDGDGVPDACNHITMAWDATWVTASDTWPELVGIYPDTDWSITDATLLRPVATSHMGLGAAWLFHGNGGGSNPQSWASLAGNPTNNAGSIELWVRPSDLEGMELLWESGGESNGASLILHDDQIEGRVTNGSPTVVSAPFAGEDFVQVVFVLDPPEDRVRIFLDGELAAQTSTTANSWTGGNPPSIAGGPTTTSIGGNWMGDADATVPLEGELAAIYLHERPLTVADVRDRYNLVHCGTAVDTDGDGVADPCDPCPLDALDDSDGDGSCDNVDPCPGDDSADADGDGVCDPLDLCPAGDDLTDTDADGTADACDPCPLDALGDQDGDGVCDSDETCPLDPAKLHPGTCGCGMADEDLNGDGLADCVVCGDGLVEAPETCDDGARLPGDGCSASCLTEALLLTGVSPGAAGTDNTFGVLNGTPGSNVRILVSNRLGHTTPVPGCPNLAVPFAWVGTVGDTTTQPDGRAVYTRFAPGSIAGSGFAFVAVEASSCRVSNAIYTVF